MIFKKINDIFGHNTGDLVLKAVSQRLQQSIRSSDTLCRYGGDEFVLMLTDLSSADEVLPVTERILAAVAQPLDIAGQELHITASIGISLYPEHADNTAAMLQGADSALYKAKAAGRNCIR